MKAKCIKQYKQLEGILDKGDIVEIEVIRTTEDQIIVHKSNTKNRNPFLMVISEDTIQKEVAEIKIELIKQYNRDYSKLVADKINEQLKDVKINTFNIQKNGDVKETFEITMFGVPYTSLNSAGKIIAGVELIQLINKSLDINFPIVIDNKESITKDFDVDNQVITLSVVKGANLGV